MRKKLKNKSYGRAAVLLLIIAFASCTSRETAHEHADTYICPMHPTVVSDKPGVCPVCGMDLVRKARPGEEVKMTEELTRLIKSTNEVVIASVKTIRPAYQSMPVTIEFQGVATYDTRQIQTIAARVGGRLEKVYLKYDYQPVRKGEKVAEVYSPELASAQRELLFLMQIDPENLPLIESAKRKLVLMGFSEEQLQALIETKEVKYSFPVYSPYSGYVVSGTPAVSAASVTSTSTGTMGSGGMGMGGSPATPVVASGNSAVRNDGLIREGSYVSAGEALFKMVSAQSIWLEWLVPASVSSHIKAGSMLEVQINEMRKPLRADFIEPVLEQGQDFIRIRSYYREEDVFIGQWVKGFLHVSTKESLWLPLEAVLDLGIDQVVFVKERGQFKPRKVVAGTRSNGYREIVKGLTSSDEVAANAHYLVDSESFIKTSR
jgi:Cu(I)/Ag(I) efflux system membrane fusion protein